MKCMVVSDSTTMRRILENALLAAGCEDVVVHSDGRVAAEAADESISAIVTDWGLPGMDGVELVRLLRAREDCAGVRVLMVTSRNARTDVELALEAGVDGYLLKPFTADALRYKIDALLQPLLRRDAEPDDTQEAENEDEARAA